MLQLMTEQNLLNLLATTLSGSLHTVVSLAVLFFLINTFLEVNPSREYISPLTQTFNFIIFNRFNPDNFAFRVDGAGSGQI